MQRRTTRFLAVSAIVVAALVPAQSSAADARPNIVFILADDEG
jgi:hypothetical protein